MSRSLTLLPATTPHLTRVTNPVIEKVVRATEGGRIFEQSHLPPHFSVSENTLNPARRSQGFHEAMPRFYRLHTSAPALEIIDVFETVWTEPAAIELTITIPEVFGNGSVATYIPVFIDGKIYLADVYNSRKKVVVDIEEATSGDSIFPPEVGSIFILPEFTS